MRRVLLRLSVALVLAALSFAFARQRYVSSQSATLTNPFNAGEQARLSNPFMDDDLFGAWMTDQVVLAIVLPVAFLAGGAAWAIRR